MQRTGESWRDQELELRGELRELENSENCRTQRTGELRELDNSGELRETREVREL